MKINMSEDKRNIEMSYNVSDNNLFYTDGMLVKIIIQKAIDNKLNCSFGIDDNSLRYIRLSSLDTGAISKVYDTIKELC